MIVTPADARNLDKILKLIGKVPEEITLDLDWANIKDEPRAGRGGRERGGRERGGRSASRSDRSRRPPPDHGQVASMEPFTPDPAAERAPPARRVEAEPEAPRRERRRPQAEPEAPRRERPRVEAEAEAEAPHRERRPRPERPLPPPPVQVERPRGRDDRRRDRDDGDRVVGFGGDAPAFLARPPAPRRSDD
jgi:hypothetical protein